MPAPPDPATGTEPDEPGVASTPDLTGALTAALTEALSAGTREAFTALLTADVRWGGERHGGRNECTTREEAGEHYAGLLDADVTLRLADLQPTDPAPTEATGDHKRGGNPTEVGTTFTATLQVRSPDPEDHLPEMAVRLRLRDGLLAEICVLDPPASIEVLYFDGCPNHETFLPHLRDLLAEHSITAPVTLIRIDSVADAQAHRFLGSPTVRVDGHDVEPGAAERGTWNPEEARSSSGGPYGMQCRLYPPDGETQRATGTPHDQWILDALIDNPTHEAAVAAIHAGDHHTLHQLLAEHPDLASTRLPRRGGRNLLHVATDWPGHHPDIATTIATLVAAGADPSTGCLGEHPETPLHWAASSNDVTAIDALLDAGADINAPGAVIGGGTPMAHATAFGQWDAARRLLDHGATTTMCEAACLGLVTQVERHLATNEPSAETITSSFWGACHGGHVTTAAILLDAGADLNWVGYDDLTPLDAARRSESPAVINWLEQRSAPSAAAQTH